MKKLIPFFLILIGCESNNNEVTITKEEYKKLINYKTNPEYPKPFEVFSEGNFESRIVLGSDRHEYIELKWKETSISTKQYNILHSPECIKCKGDTLKTKQ